MKRMETRIQISSKYSSLPLFGMKVPLEIHEKESHRERAILRKDCVQISIHPSKSIQEKETKIRIQIEKLLRKLLLEMLQSRVQKYAQEAMLSFKNIRVKKMKSRWGSCSSLGNLNFNIGLSLVPMRILDYVVVHELCHLKELNHSPRFWAEVEKILPSYKSDRRWLRDHEIKVLGYFYNIDSKNRILEHAENW